MRIPNEGIEVFQELIPVQYWSFINSICYLSDMLFMRIPNEGIEVFQELQTYIYDI